jgi:hypothetical protein
MSCWAHGEQTTDLMPIKEKKMPVFVIFYIAPSFNENFKEVIKISNMSLPRHSLRKTD